MSKELGIVEDELALEILEPKDGPLMPTNSCQIMDFGIGKSLGTKLGFRKVGKAYEALAVEIGFKDLHIRLLEA